MKKFRVEKMVVFSVLAASLAVSCPVVPAGANAPAATSNVPVQPAPIQWASSFSAAQQQARATGKLIMIDFYTDWCGWCQLLDTDTYPDSRVKILAAHFVPLKLDAEKGGATLAKKYNIDAYPIIVFVDADGKVVKRIEGYQDGSDFTESLSQILQDRSGKQLSAAAANQPKDVEAQVAMTIMNAALGKIEEAEKFRRQAETADPHNQSGMLGAVYQALADYYFYDKNDYGKSVDCLTNQIRVSNNGEETIIAQLMLGYSYIHLQQKSKAIAPLQSVLNNSGASKDAKDLAQELLDSAK